MNTSSNRQIRWGVVGCGQIAVDRTIPAIHAASQAVLVAVADPIAEQRHLAAAIGNRNESTTERPTEHPVRQYADYSDLIRDPEVDAVYIALPTHMHLESVLRTVYAGKPILCEKPLGRSADEVLQMVNAARNARVPLMTAYMSRFGSAFVDARQSALSGAIGQITFVYADFSYTANTAYPLGVPGAWRWTDPLGGGPLLDIGIYLAFGLREILDDTIAVVGAYQGDTIAPIGAANHDTTAAWFRTVKGVPGALASTFSHNECCIRLYGTKGAIEIVDCFSQNPTGRVLRTDASGRSVPEVPINQPASPRLFEHYLREIAHCSDCLIEGREPRPSPEEALLDALLLDALKSSGQQGGLPVNIPALDSYVQRIPK